MDVYLAARPRHLRHHAGKPVASKPKASVSELVTGVDRNGDPTGGDVIKIPFADPTSHISLTGGTLPIAGGVAVASDGTVYAVGGSAFLPITG